MSLTAVQEERQRGKDRNENEVESTSSANEDMPVEKILEAELAVEPKTETYIEANMGLTPSSVSPSPSPGPGDSRSHPEGSWGTEGSFCVEKRSSKMQFLALLWAQLSTRKAEPQPPVFGAFCPTATRREGMLEGIIQRARREGFLVINSQC